jgi:RNA polymerase sigma-70 factor (ECF subfamily)
MAFDGSTLSLLPAVAQATASTLPASRLDAADFGRLWRSEHPKLLALASRMTGNGADAEEVVQEAFLQAWRARERFAGQSRPSTWLYRITANAALMHLRSRRRRPLEFVDDIAAVVPCDDGPAPHDPLTAALTHERRALLWSAVGRLPPRDRALVVDVLGDADESVGEHGSATARKSRLTRSRARLRCDAALAAVI